MLRATGEPERLVGGRAPRARLLPCCARGWTRYDGLRVALLVLVLVTFTACDGVLGPRSQTPIPPSIDPSTLPSPSGAGAAPALSPSRIAVIVMEDKEYTSIIGSRDAPYINSLAQTYGLATEFYAVAPHGLFDYLALIGGSTFRSCPTCPVTHVSALNLVDQLEDAGVSWKAYMEDMPEPCFKKASYRRYVKRHDPFLYFDSIAQDRGRCAKVVPYPELATDLAQRALPMFIWITPNLCHNTHDCSVATGDAFLSKLVPKLLRALGPDGLLFLTWDEGLTMHGCCRYARGGHVVTIMAGPAAKRGFRSDTPFDHYSILRTIEDAWGFDLLGKAACRCTKPMRVFCRTSCRARR